MGDQSDARLLPAKDNTNTEKTQTSIPRVGFEPTTKACQRAEICRAFDLATVNEAYCSELLYLNGMYLVRS
jgi:hypothetical protein